MRIAALAVAVAAVLPAFASALDIPITLSESAGVARTGEPVTVGVPIPRGVLADAADLCIVAPGGGKVPAQFEVTGWWWPTEKFPDRQRSVRWVLADFQADVPAGGSAVYRLADTGDNPPPARPVAVTTKNAVTTVGTGPMALTINGDSFRLFESVALDGRPLVAAAAVAAPGGAAADDDGLRVATMTGERYTSGRDTVAPPRLTDADYRGGYDGYLKDYAHNPPANLRVAVERRGPMRAVVMIDGVLPALSAGKDYEFVLYNVAGERVGPVKLPGRDEKIGFRIRIHAYAGKPFVRVFHTLINLRGKSHTDTDMNRYHSAAYIADACRETGDFLIEALELGTSLQLDGPTKFLLGGDEVHAGDLAADAKRTLYQDSSAGWVWQAGRNDMWDPALKENAAYMAGRGEKRPYWEYADIHYTVLTGQDGCTFPGYQLRDGSEKVLAAGRRAAGWADLSDGKAGMTVAVRRFWRMFPKALEVGGDGRVTVGLLPRQWGRGHFLDGKIHRTHELLYRFHGPEDAAATEAAARGFETPLVAHCGFDAYLDSGACGLFARPDPKDWPNYEAQQTTAVHLGVNPKVNPSFDSSMEIEREKQDAYGWQHFGDTSKRGFRGHSQFQEFDTSRCLWMHFFRTADPNFFVEAANLDRFLMGIPCFGGGYGHQHPESSHNWIQGLIYYYHLTGSPEAKEAIEAMKGYYRREWDPRAHSWTYNGRNAAYALNGLRQFFEWTGDPAWLAAANTCIRSVKQRTRPVSGFYGGNPGDFMQHVLCHALGRYALLTGDDDAVDHLLGLAGFFKPHSGQGAGGEVGDCYAYMTLLTGDPVPLKTAIANSKDSQCVDQFGPHWRTGEGSTKTWSTSVGGYWQVLFYAARQWKPTDTRPPAAVTDLAAAPGPQPGSATLTWTNPGDDGMAGRAARLQVKYAPGEIVELIPWSRNGVNATVEPQWKDKVNFWYATNAFGEPAPGEPGTKQTWTLTGLPPGKPLYFALKAHDEAGNRGPISNCVEVTVP